MGLLPQLNRKTGAIVLLFGAALLLQGRQVQAAPQIYKLDLTYSRVVNNRDLQASEVEHKDWTTAVSFSAGIQAGIYYFEPNFHFESCFQKVCTVGLEIYQGFQLLNWLSIEHYHHSKHRADQLPSNGSETAYPLQDFVGVRIQFIPDSRKMK